MPAIEVEGLTKRYGAVQALRGVGFAVEPGEVLGLLGPNGAGKTTTLRILAGLVRPDGGTVRLLGRPGGPARSRTPLGYLPGEPRFDADLTPAALLDRLAGLRPGRGAPRRGAAIDALGLAPRDLGRRIKTLSHGTRQKVALVGALQHDPELIVLDEPTNGLDPLVQRSFRAYLLDRAAAGRAVLLSSHVLSEVEALCERVVLLRAGERVAAGTVEELRRRVLRRAQVRLRAAPATDPASVAGVRRVEGRGVALTLWVQGDLRPLLAWLAAAEVEDLVFPEPALEDVFPAFYEAGDARG